jgi:hypothetical protein
MEERKARGSFSFSEDEEQQTVFRKEAMSAFADYDFVVSPRCAIRGIRLVCEQLPPID